MSWSVQSYLVGWVAVCSCSTVKAPRWPPSWPRGWSGVFYSLQCRVRCYSGSSPGCTWCHWYLSCVSHCGPKPHSSPQGWACPLNRWASWAGTWPRGRGTWCWDRTEQEERRSGIDSRKKTLLSSMYYVIPLQGITYQKAVSSNPSTVLLLPSIHTSMTQSDM